MYDCITDHLIFDGESHWFSVGPEVIECDMVRKPLDEIARFNYPIYFDCSFSEHGYAAKWLIEDLTLYLVSVHGSFEMTSKTRVEASWVSGKFIAISRVGKGATSLEDAHIIHMTIEKGKIINYTLRKRNEHQIIHT